MSASPGRRAALEVVRLVRERQAFAHETMDAVLERSKLDQRDAAFATRLAYGTVATRGTLEEAVLNHVTQPSRIDPKVLDALVLSAHEVLFMRTPSRAAVSEGVELVKSIQPRAAGMANAVLRRVAERSENFPWGDPDSDLGALARLHGHPDWMTRLFVTELGLEHATAMLAANNEPAPMFLASLGTKDELATLRAGLADDGVTTHECPLDGCLVAEDPKTARRSSAVAQRKLLVMDAGAQFAVRSLGVAPGMHVVEIGAGRGSKSLLIAAHARQLGGRVRLTAVDVHGFKLKALASLAATLGFGEIDTLEADVLEPAFDMVPETVDRVLVDAPCSGLGTLRRHPDRRWRARPEEIDALSALGRKMLERASRLVRPGGFVVYSTCTITSAENGEVVRDFLASDAGRGFSVDPLSAEVPDEWSRFLTPEGWFQSLPENQGPDGHFVARLVRR